MKDRVLVILLCLCALLLGALLRPRPVPAALADGPGPISPVGRYSIATANDRIYFADTRTGRLWYRDTGLVLSDSAKGGFVKPSWREMPSPATAPGQR